MSDRSFKTPKGTELPFLDIKGKPYLGVQHRIVWFREEKVDWSIETEFLERSPDKTVARAIIKDPTGRILATAHKSETKQGFKDHMEKAESSAVGRALAFLGYGTAYALELEEGEDRLADAPPHENRSQLPIGTHNEALEANGDSFNFLIQVGSLEGQVLGDVDEKVLATALQKAKEYYKSNKSIKVKNFIDHADHFLANVDEASEAGHSVSEVSSTPKPRASSSQVTFLLKEAQKAKINPVELSDMIRKISGEELTTLTVGTFESVKNILKTTKTGQLDHP